ncbi:MAG: thioredoxin [Planctomycetota bacterium]|nr:thioredoxin [Planctomycetota bacterium]
MGEHTVAVSDATFKSEVEDSKGIVLVDFWAQWCPPCRAIAPHLDAIASEMAGKLKVCKVDVDESPDAASRYEVRSIPCLIIFKDGREVDRSEGAKSKGDLTNWIKRHLTT